MNVSANNVSRDASAEGRGLGSLRVTERDIEMMRWIARYRIATHEQVAERFAGGPEGIRRRLGRLSHAGFLERRQVLARCPSLYVTTSLGSDTASVALPPATMDVRTLVHDMAVTSLGCELERSGRRVVTEREMRSIEAAGTERPYSVKFQTAAHGRAPGHHYPDLVILDDDHAGGIVAVEYEIAAKGARRLRAILEAYLFAQHITRVIYYVEQPSVERRLKLLAGELHLTKLEVRGVEPC